MREGSRFLLTVLGLLLTLWLMLGFWPLSATTRWLLSLLVIAAGGGVLWCQWRQQQSRQHALRDISTDHFPPHDFQGNVLLVAGDAAAWFAAGQPFREARQGWYLQAETPAQLVGLAAQLATARPSLLPQVAVILGFLPEHHSSDDLFSQSLRGWQRAVVQSRRWLNALPPVLVVLVVAGPSHGAMSDDQVPARWFTITPDSPGVRVRPASSDSISLNDWLQESPAEARLSRLSEAFWLDALQTWYQRTVAAQLSCQQGDLPAQFPVAVGFCLTPVAAVADNLWQQHIAAMTTLAPSAGTGQEVLPLPNVLLNALSRPRGLSRTMQFWRQAGLMTGLFLLLAMLASFIHNQRLIHRIGDHLALYYRPDGDPPASRTPVQQRLEADSKQLDDWQQHGAPLRYGLGLYQGGRLAPPVEVALSKRTPPPEPRPVIKTVVQAPKVVRLDSLSLFDSGKAQLRSDSTKVLVSTLVGIKARPGWLIVVSGHTDNTGNPPLNQALSQKRAEAVRNWIRDTGDVPESCFAVQGYGEDRPVATNDTPEGRALNRRVEISLVPQAGACRLPGVTPAPSPDDGASITEMEK